MPNSAASLVAFLREDAFLYRQRAGALCSPPARTELLRLASEALERALAVALAVQSEAARNLATAPGERMVNAQPEAGQSSVAMITGDHG